MSHPTIPTTWTHRPLLWLVAWVPLSGVLAYFLAGALIFPLVQPYYASRVISSLGLMALIYGLECVARMGMIETCGFVSGNCSQHDLSSDAQVLWLALMLAGIVLAGLAARKSPPPGR